jgi:hypothetical protein
MNVWIGKNRAGRNVGVFFLSQLRLYFLLFILEAALFFGVDAEYRYKFYFMSVAVFLS